MHPTTPFDYSSETNYECTYLAMHPWGIPTVFTVGGEALNQSYKVADEILGRNIIKEWLDEWVATDGAAQRQEYIMRIRLKTSLPKNLANIPSAPDRSSCPMDSALSLGDCQKCSKNRRRKALWKEMKWRNEMTMIMIES